MKKGFVYTLLGIVLVLNIGMWGIYIQSQSFPAKAQSETQAVAESEYNLNTVQNFYIFNRDQTIYTLQGQKNDGTAVYVFYNPETKDSQEVPADQLISEEQALAVTKYDLPDVAVREANLGIDDDQISWEVSFTDADGRLGYHYLQAETGTWYETINDL